MEGLLVVIVYDQGDVVLRCRPRDGTYRSVPSRGDQYLRSLTHCVPRKNFCLVTDAQLANIDEPVPGGATDGGLVHPGSR
jgi:hypothetical protein